MKPKHPLAATLFIAYVLLGAQAADANDSKAPKIPVFVTAAQSQEGFTDPSKARQDSVRDVANKVKGSRVLRVVDRAEEAVITLEVLGRGTHREVNGWTAAFGSAQNKSTVAVRLTAGDFVSELEGTSGSKGMLTGYSDAAGKVVKQVEDWAAKNWEPLQKIWYEVAAAQAADE